MSNNDKWVKMETMRTNNSSVNKSNTTKDPGIYTCPTCNALFTCLKFYQQHVTQHAEANGTKLYCCNKCRYSSENLFQFNWHQMSHKGPPHSCSVCQDKSTSDNYSSSNHLNGRDEESIATVKSSRKSQQNGNSNKKIKYYNYKAYVKNQQEENEEEDDDDEDDDSENGSEDGEESDDKEEEGDGEGVEVEEGDEEEESEEGDEEEEDEEDDEEDDDDDDDDQEEVEEEPERNAGSQIQMNQYQNLVLVQQQDDEQEISDDEVDDEEEEVESEADEGDNNELPEEYLVAQRLNNEVYQYDDMQNQQSHLNNNVLANNNCGLVMEVNQGPPYTKSQVSDMPELLNSDGIICNKGRGKGNRKSRTINQMGGQVDDETSLLRRKFHCSHCGKSFKTKSHLQRHILTHTGEKPYHCNRCGAKFNQSSSLRNHIIALHTKEYPHFCNHCNKGFLMPALLQKHLQTSHRDVQDQQLI